MRQLFCMTFFNKIFSKCVYYITQKSRQMLSQIKKISGHINILDLVQICTYGSGFLRNLTSLRAARAKLSDDARPLYQFSRPAGGRPKVGARERVCIARQAQRGKVPQLQQVLVSISGNSQEEDISTR